MLKPTLEALSSVQRETHASITSSKDVLRAHREFCRHMQETLQYVASGQSHLLAYDSEVVAAGRAVNHTFITLDSHVGSVQTALQDVVRELLRLGTKGPHIPKFNHHHTHTLWERIQPKLIDVTSAIMLIITHISTFLGFFHPVFHIIGGVARGVYGFLSKLNEHVCSCLRDHHGELQSPLVSAFQLNVSPIYPTAVLMYTLSTDHGLVSKEIILEILKSIYEHMQKRQIEHVQEQTQHVYDNMEKPMMEFEEQLEDHAVYVTQKDAFDAAEKWRKLRERLDTIITVHCKA